MIKTCNTSFFYSPVVPKSPIIPEGYVWALVSGCSNRSDSDAELWLKYAPIGL